jgi:signal transduction histidine kinase
LAYLGKISNTAAESIEETRSIVRDLIPQNLALFGLTEAIMNMIDQIQDASGVVFDARAQNIDDLLSKESELSVYRIVQECLNNILKHSGSSRGRVEILKTQGFISIVIEDYGKGFASSENGSSTVKEGIGLFSIAERVQFLGGNIGVDSVIGKGTRISISIKISG